MYSSACHRVHRFTRLPTLALPAIAADFGVQEMRHHAGDRVGRDDGVGIDADEDFRVANVLQSVVKRLGLAASWAW